jgi:Glycosyltransferase
MRIALLTSTLEGGGAARVMVNMANYWAREGHHVALYSFEDGSRPSFYAVGAGVEMCYLDLAKRSSSLLSSLRNNWERIVKIRRNVLKFKPDVLISFIDTANVRVLASLIGSGVPVIVSERIHPAYEDIGRLWSALRLATYPLASAVVMQTERSREFFPGFLQGRMAVVPNPVTLPEVLGDAPALPPRTILAVGRLYAQKGYDVLLDAFALLARRCPDWSLAIAGSGGLRDELGDLAKGLGVADRVRFLGAVRDVGGLLKQAEIYVMSSRYEGFPNALCEAMAAGLPCVSTDCPSGPAEIVRHGENGLLVANGDAEALAEALERLVRDEGLRLALGRRAAELANALSEDRVMERWETLAREVVGRRERSASSDGMPAVTPKDKGSQVLSITVVLLNIRGGGSVYAALNWANAWQEAGHAVTVVVTSPDEGTGPDFYVHPGIRLVVQDLADRPVKSRVMALKRLLGRLYRLRRAVATARPDVVVAVDGPVNVLTLMACVGRRVPIVVFEQVHPGQYSLGSFWGAWRERLYPKAAALLNLTKSATRWCEQRFSLQRTATIPNPVMPPVIEPHDTADGETAERTPGRRTVVAAGRLVEQKRFDLLIEAFALTADVHRDWDLIIYGEGEDRPDLEKLVADKGLAERITLPGWTRSLSSKLARCDFFVLSSGYEGFGNVIAEAMAVGLPVVSFDCEAGPSDIIRHEVDGLLVPPLDVPALASAMMRLMEDDAYRAALGKRAPEVLERFSLESTLALWDEVFVSIGVLGK